VTLKRPVIGWLLDTDHRKALLARIEPAYARTIAHHVTLKPDAEAGEAAPEARTAAVVGVADDGAGVAWTRRQGEQRRDRRQGLDAV
jgi:hypothetical protein